MKPSISSVVAVRRTQLIGSRATRTVTLAASELTSNPDARPGEFVAISVRDNGNGIALALRDKIFLPFFTTKPAGAGTGLGLSISYDIVVRLHGGRLQVESEEGSFAELIVALPKRPTAPL